MSIQNTFVLVAPDCPVGKAVIPLGKAGQKPIHVIQYELLIENPYTYTHETLIYETHIQHKNILKPDKIAVWQTLFQKSHACLRASALPKKYGWGVHYNNDGKIALYAMESTEYERFSQNQTNDLKVVRAMRNKRA